MAEFWSQQVSAEAAAEVWCFINTTRLLTHIDARLELDTQRLNAYHRKMVYEYVKCCAPALRVITLGCNGDRLRRMRITMDNTRLRAKSARMSCDPRMILRGEGDAIAPCPVDVTPEDQLAE